jgi:hypothetical protein
MQSNTKRRLALIGVLLLTQIVSACCVYPVGTRYGRGDGHHQRGR